MYKVSILKEGYSKQDGSEMIASGTSTLVEGKNVCLIVDTLSAWDKDFLIETLREKNLSCKDVNHVVCSHGHPDHVGNLNLFLEAEHIVGWSIYKKDVYKLHPFEQGESYKLAEGLEVIPTPGHTLSDVSVVVHSAQQGIIVIAGDLFEKLEDIENPSIWREIAGSENPELQIKNRQKVLNLADVIIPGHGPMFNVTQHLRNTHKTLLKNK